MRVCWAKRRWLTDGAVHASRDRILLEGESDADDDFADDDEVFALRGVGASSDSEPEPDAEDAPAPSKEKAKAKKDKKKTKKKKNESEDESDEEGWGRKKSAYYADDDVASDDDDAQQLQEAEARRVQAKARADLTDDDFGLADLRIADEPACAHSPGHRASAERPLQQRRTARSGGGPGPADGQGRPDAASRAPQPRDARPRARMGRHRARAAQGHARRRKVCPFEIICDPPLICAQGAGGEPGRA